jgi:hypothetical protein
MDAPDDARPCFARRPVVVLRRLHLELGLRYFGFGLFALGVVAALGIAPTNLGPFGTEP